MKGRMQNGLWAVAGALGAVSLLWLQSATAAIAQAPIRWRAASFDSVRGIVIQHNGRYKPLDSFAREALITISGEAHLGRLAASTRVVQPMVHAWPIDREDPVATLLSIMAEPERWQEVPLAAVPFMPLREPLGLDPKTKYVSYNTLVSTRKLMRMLPPIVEKQQREEKLSILENETMDMFQRFVALNALLEQKLELVPPSSGTGAWLPILQPEGYTTEQQRTFREQWTALLTAVRGYDQHALEVAGRRLADTLERANPEAYPPIWRRRLELFYNRFQPFYLARFFYFFAGLAFLIVVGHGRSRVDGWPAFFIGAGVHGAGIAARVIVGGRPPVSNFFETMLWLPFMAVVISLILERVYRVRHIALAASLLAAITLTLADYVPLDASITPVVAVLRSNKWLTIHVLTVVASYGALALATALAHVYGWRYLQRPDHPSLTALSLSLYRTIQVGVVLLASGIMLGAVWANASWGRYWGWDPKETWALITLLWFLAILHGRFAGWIRGVRLALSTIGGFFLLLMTYYGVSFYLVGLHSYAGGHAKPLPSLLVAYLIAEVAFLLAIGLAAMRRGALASQ